MRGLFEQQSSDRSRRYGELTLSQRHLPHRMFSIRQVIVADRSTVQQKHRSSASPYRLKFVCEGVAPVVHFLFHCRDVRHGGSKPRKTLLFVLGIIVLWRQVDAVTDINFHGRAAKGCVLHPRKFLFEFIYPAKRWSLFFRLLPLPANGGGDE